MNALKTQQPEAVSIDLSYLYELADGSNDFIKEMLTLFMASVPEALNQIKTGLEQKDWNGIKATAHKIKPSFGFIGVGQAQELLGQMEKNINEAPDLLFLNTAFDKVQDIAAKCIPALEKELTKINQQ